MKFWTIKFNHQYLFSGARNPLGLTSLCSAQYFGECRTPYYSGYQCSKYADCEGEWEEMRVVFASWMGHLLGLVFEVIVTDFNHICKVRASHGPSSTRSLCQPSITQLQERLQTFALYYQWFKKKKKCYWLFLVYCVFYVYCVYRPVMLLQAFIWPVLSTVMQLWNFLCQRIVQTDSLIAFKSEIDF